MLTAQSDLSYCNCDLTYDEVKSQDFIPIEDGVINNGQDYGSYWIKVIQQGDATARIVRLPYARLRNPALHSDALPGHLDSEKAYFEFQLPALERPEPYYIYVEAYRIGYIPIEIVNRENFSSRRARFTLRLGMYYGFSVAIFLCSLFLYFFFREKTYLYYSILLVILGFTFAFEDGAFHFWGFSWAVADVFDSILHWTAGISCALLAWDYVRFEYHLPRIKWPLIATSAISGICYLVYHFTGSVIASSFGDVFTVICLAITGIGSFLLYHKTIYARLFSFAFVMILICAIDVYIPKHFGWSFIGLSQQALKIGNVVGMIMFGVVIAFRINHMHRQNLKHKAEIRKMLEEISQEETDPIKIPIVPPPKEDVRAKYAMLEEYELTDRQLDILDGIKQGLSNQEIADDLNISLNTVKYHTRNIYEKMGVKRRAQVIALK